MDARPLARHQASPFPRRNHHVNRADRRGVGAAETKPRLMARPYLAISVLLVAAAAAVMPAHAQFGSIFGPPRPPADVPDAAPSAPPNFPSSRDRFRDSNRDLPPDEPLPAPMTLPPEQRPGSSIESVPLAPPPGTLQQQQQQPAAPLRNVPPAQQAAPQQQPQTLPGLAPGQRQPRAAPQQQPAAVSPQQEKQPQPAAIEPPPSDEVELAPPEHRLENPTAVFSGLDKITGRTITFDVAINETVQFGALQVTPRACYSRPPTETPRTDAFVAVDEVTLQGEVKRIFTGWMFAASPGLHAVEHPIYDVWLSDCKGAAQPAVAEVPDDSAKRPQPRRRAPQTPPRPPSAPSR